jgi:iron complex outermembrane receptor protein
MRFNWDETLGGAAIQFDPLDRRYGVQSVFVQDEIAVLPGRLFATLGVKYEHNAFSGGELQPNVRARLAMNRNQVLWGGVSRVVRRPTRIDDDVVVRGPGAAVLVQGTHQFEAEKLTATELGYRIQPAAVMSFEATAFWHDYDDLRSQDAPATGVIPLTIGNTLEGRARGVEFGLNVQPLAWWRSHATYTFLHTAVARQPGSRDTTRGAAEINDPDHLFALRSSVDLPQNIEADAILRAVGALPNPASPAYTELTLRGGWHMTPRVELFVVGDDLLHGRHAEVGAAGAPVVEFERSARVGLTVRF